MQTCKMPGSLRSDYIQHLERESYRSHKDGPGQGGGGGPDEALRQGRGGVCTYTHAFAKANQASSSGMSLPAQRKSKSKRCEHQS